MPGIANVDLPVVTPVPHWRRLIRSVATAIVAFALIVGPIQQPADACSIQYVDLQYVLDNLTGNLPPETDATPVVGFVEVEVFSNWPATSTYAAASAAAPRTIWGEAPSPSLVIHGGLPISPSTTSSGCRDGARPVGETWWLAVFDKKPGIPVRGILMRHDGAEVTAIEPAVRAVLNERLGDPRIVEPPAVSRTHPSESAAAQPIATEGSSTTSPLAVDQESPARQGRDDLPGLIVATLVLAGMGGAALGLHLRTRRLSRHL